MGGILLIQLGFHSAFAGWQVHMRCWVGGPKAPPGSRPISAPVKPRCPAAWTPGPRLLPAGQAWLHLLVGRGGAVWIKEIVRVRCPAAWGPMRVSGISANPSTLCPPQGGAGWRHSQPPRTQGSPPLSGAVCRARRSP